MSYESIMKELKSGTYHPIYFLHGPEAFFIDKIADYIERNALSEAEKAFNFTTFYGKEVDHMTVVDTARRYPMMAPRQVVIIKEAQEMKNLKGLQTYVEKPFEQTILVICHKHKKYNFNSTMGKLLKQKSCVFESKSLYDNEVPGWITKYLKGKGLKIKPIAAELIAEYLGKDLSKVANELDKLAVNISKEIEITPKEVEENIGISKDYNIFELQKALGAKDIEKVNRIIQYFASNPKKNPIPVVIGSLYNYFSKVYTLHAVSKKSDSEILAALNLRSAYFLKDYKKAIRSYGLAKTESVISLLYEYDLKSKGVNFNSVGKAPDALLKELTWKILH